MMQIGDTFTWKRTFTNEEVLLFGKLSGDQGIHHIQPDAQGRLMVQGLFTASVPTKLGGDINYIAREMKMEFLRPVFTGDTIYCEMTVKQLEPKEGYLALVLDCVCRNQDGKIVLTGGGHGIIRDNQNIL